MLSELDNLEFKIERSSERFPRMVSRKQINATQIELIKEDDWYEIDVLQIKEGIEEIVSDDGIRRRSPFDRTLQPESIHRATNRVSKEFPEKMMFFTTDELGIMAFNELGDNSHFVGLSGNLENVADGIRMDSLMFLFHDINDHGGGLVEFPKGVLDRVNKISNKSDREKIALALYTYRHEAEGYMMRNHSQSALEEMMTSPRVMKRWLNPDDLQGLLPDGVDVKDEAEVESFLRASAHLVSEILSGPQQ